MDPNRYRLRQSDFGTQLLTGDNDDDTDLSPLTLGIELHSDDDDTFVEIDKNLIDEDIDVEEFEQEAMDNCQPSIQRMMNVDLPSLSLPQLMWFTHAFCAVNHLKVHETLNTKIKTTDEAVFLNPKHGQQYMEWVEKGGKEYRYYYNIWVAEVEHRRSTWKDCQNPNNPVSIDFKNPSEGEAWKYDQVFYQSIIIKYLSENNYEDEVFIHHDLSNGILTLDQFLNYNGAENPILKNFGSWLFREVYNDAAQEEAKPTLDWLIEEWKSHNASYFQVNSGPQIPQNFKDFIEKGIFF